jgi:methyl-accepting chemotaxis protein
MTMAQTVVGLWVFGPALSTGNVIEGIFMTITVLLVAGLISVIVAMEFVNRRILSSVRGLEDAARRIGQGEVDYRIEPDDGGKIGEVVLAFNGMLDRRRESNAELREEPTEPTALTEQTALMETM